MCFDGAANLNETILMNPSIPDPVVCLNMVGGLNPREKLWSLGIILLRAPGGTSKKIRNHQPPAVGKLPIKETCP